MQGVAMRASVLCIALSLAALPALAAPPHQMTVKELQGFCDKGMADRCQFFILGVAEGATLAKGIKTSDGTLCFRDDLTTPDMVSAVRAQIASDLKVYPEDAKIPASGMIVAVLVHSFPCRK